MSSETDPRSIAAALVAPAKGILAADESDGTMRKRFAAVGLESIEPTRRAYREMLFSTPDLARHISGVILFDETIRQSAWTGEPFPALLAGRGIVPGIKVDKGTVPLPAAAPETVTEGLDGLARRLTEYRTLGARFAKWRAVFRIGNGMPSDYAVAANAHALARYAACCQQEGLVPIVEPETLMDGEHTVEQAAVATGRVLHAVYDALYAQRVELPATLLKPNMVLAGYSAARQPTLQAVATATREVLRAQVPAAVPGVVFLSGGQSDEDATLRLNALNAAGDRGPWQLSFSFGRALQGPALRSWAAEPQNPAAAQAALLHRAALNSAARSGRYQPEMETGAVVAPTPRRSEATAAAMSSGRPR